MNPDLPAERLRHALGVIGDRSLPALTFEAIVARGVEAPTRHPRPHRMLLPALVVAGLITAVMLVVTTGRDSPTIADGTLASQGRTIAVPTFVPPGFALDEAASFFFGAELGRGQTDEADVVLRYSGPGATLEIVSGMGDRAAPPADSAALILPSGTAVSGFVSDEFVRIWWQEPGGPVVSIVATGVELDLVEQVADSMWFTTPKTWGTLTEYAGFLNGETAGRGFDRWVPPGDEIPLGVAAVYGQLQTGLRLSFGDGVLWATPTQAAGTCFATSLDNEGFFLIGDAATVAFVVTGTEEPSRRIVAEHPPGMPRWRVATLLVDGASGQLPPTVTLACERSAS